MAAAVAKEESPLIKIGILLLLLAALSFVLMYFNILSCGFYTSVGCDVFYSITAGGKPKILVLHGSEGIGDPEFLFETLKGPKIRGRVEIREIEITSLPVLQQYQMVVVERARTMSLEDFKMFQDYVARGGKLVWVADAGTIAPSNESDSNYFLKYSDRTISGKEEFISPWARREGNRQVSMDFLLGVEFVGNYCELVEKCFAQELVGFFDFPDQDKKIVYGLSQSLPFYGNFSIVEENNETFYETLAFLDYGSDFIAEPSEKYFWLKHENTNFGNSFPVIVSSGVGGRVLYYAFPPEYFVSEKMPIDGKTGERLQYWALIENMYYGMLYK